MQLWRSEPRDQIHHVHTLARHVRERECHLHVNLSQVRVTKLPVPSTRSRKWPLVQRDPRADPPDRVEGAAQAAASEPLEEAASVPRRDVLGVLRQSRSSGKATRKGRLFLRADSGSKVDRRCEQRPHARDQIPRAALALTRCPAPRATAKGTPASVARLRPACSRGTGSASRSSFRRAARDAHPSCKKLRPFSDALQRSSIDFQKRLPETASLRFMP